MSWVTLPKPGGGAVLLWQGKINAGRMPQMAPGFVDRVLLRAPGRFAVLTMRP
jgi:hypothetical protein